MFITDDICELNSTRYFVNINLTSLLQELSNFLGSLCARVDGGIERSALGTAQMHVLAILALIELGLVLRVGLDLFALALGSLGGADWGIGLRGIGPGCVSLGWLSWLLGWARQVLLIVITARSALGQEDEFSSAGHDSSSTTIALNELMLIDLVGLGVGVWEFTVFFGTAHIKASNTGLILNVEDQLLILMSLVRVVRARPWGTSDMSVGTLIELVNVVRIRHQTIGQIHTGLSCAFAGIGTRRSTKQGGASGQAHS